MDEKIGDFFLKLNSLQIERRINNNFEEIKKKKEKVWYRIQLKIYLPSLAL